MFWEKLTRAGILKAAYPVGSIYMSVNSTSPADLFGGTWEAIHGRFLVAEGSNGQTGNKLLNLAAGASGGETNHTLSVAEMPSHSHVAAHAYGTVGWKDNSPWYYLSTNAASYVGGYNPGTSAAGGSGAHNNLPPYLAVYMWKRTA